MSHHSWLRNVDTQSRQGQGLSRFTRIAGFVAFGRCWLCAPPSKALCCIPASKANLGGLLACGMLLALCVNRFGSVHQVEFAGKHDEIAFQISGNTGNSQILGVHPWPGTRGTIHTESRWDCSLVKGRKGESGDVDTGIGPRKTQQLTAFAFAQIVE